jgi:serine/threonine protein kinase
MKQIQVSNFLSTGIYSAYSSIISIEIDDAPFGGGNFGDVYNCISINGNAISTPQVIKIYKESFPGSAADNAKTITRLQNKLTNLSNDLKAIGKTLFAEYPAFKGIPQFSFEGILNGKKINGFSSDNLTISGFEEFEKIIATEQLRNKFYDIPVERKIYFAFQLASAFKKLDEFNYIHADLKEGAIFLNLKTHELAIIDYDSGVITENTNDKPSTWGAIGDWVAPEIYEQIGKINNGGKINVDVFTDRWSVAIGINYLISGIHPTFFLKNQGTHYYPLYFNNNNKWPNAEITAPYMKQGSGSLYNQYIEFLNKNIPHQIKEKMANTINFGYKNPAARTSYNEWQTVLQSIQKPPLLNFLSISKNEILSGENVVFAWSADNTISVEIETIGTFSSIDKKSFKPTKNATYKIIFKGYYGQLIEYREIKVIPAPKFKEFLSEHIKLKKGDTTFLIWNIENITEAKLIGAENDSFVISKTGKQTIKPEQTTVYKIEVTALDGKTIIEKYLTVEVFEEGQISFFKADRQFIFPTIPTTLSWEVNNALKVEIEGLGNFQLSGQTTVQPTVDTTYKLMVTDNFGSITRDLQIKMLPLPVIEKLLIPSPNIISQSTINIALPNYTSNTKVLPKVVALNKNNFKLILDSNIFIKSPNITNIEYKIEEVSFFERLKKVITLIKKEFNNEKNKKYVIKK